MFPSNEQMMADLEGKIPEWKMQMLKDSLAFIERMESQQLARMVANLPPVGGEIVIRKPPPYLQKEVDKPE